MMFVGNLWNVIDFIPLLLVTASITITYLPLTRHRITEQRYLNAISAFFMWVRVFDFLTLYRSFAHLIKTLVTVLDDMRAYITLLVIAIIAFAGTFYLLSNNQDPIDRYLLSYPAALMMMWDWTLSNQDSSVFGPRGYALQYFFYMLACLGLMVLMLNILIAIISESHAKVQRSAEVNMYASFSQVITENETLVSARQRQQPYLVITQEESQKLTSAEDSFERRVAVLSERLSTASGRMFSAQSQSDSVLVSAE